MENIDEQQIRLWWSLFRESRKSSPEEPTIAEIRIILNKTQNYSGYFTDVETLISELKAYSQYNIYFVINQIDGSCTGREQYNKIIRNPTSTTSDSDIVGRGFVFLDIDVKKAAGSNSNEEEFQYSRAVANKVYKFLRDNGLCDIIVNMSGNGFHLFIPCRIAATKENDELIKRFTTAMGFLFSDEKVEIDQSIFNRARIAKLPGTYSRKGTRNNPDRPQRMAYIVKYKDELVDNDIEYFRKIANMCPEPEKPSQSNNFRSEKFDLDAFLERYNIEVTERVKINGGTRYILDHCVFNDSHKGKDAAIFLGDNGAISYYCFHNSCSQYTWKDVRLKFEPDAYSKRDYSEFQRKMPYYGSPHQFREVFKPKPETPENGKKWLSMKDVKYVDASSLPTIPTGFGGIDRAVGGLILGEVTIVSGSNSSGKSSWLNCLGLNAIEKGWKTAIWSGELVPYRLKNWLNQSAAGKSYVVKKDGYDNMYYVPQATSNKIDLWTSDKLYLYNNDYGSRWEQLCADIKELIKEKDVKLVIIDNLMAVNLEGVDGDANTKQKNFILEINDLAKKENVHIIVVCHPRKDVSFLRKESISGSGDITNLASNVFILHRVNIDFQTRGKDFFGESKINSYMCYGNVLEIAKSRATGVCDHLVGFYYEIETRRFKNSLSEHINYGWTEYDPQCTIPTNELYKEVEKEYEEDKDYSQYSDSVFETLDTCPF